MAYNGSVHGRKSPSFPGDSDDMGGVFDAMRRIKAREGNSGLMIHVRDKPGADAARRDDAVQQGLLPAELPAAHAVVGGGE